MKILKLRFKNLNSLMGEWSIDFTRPEYVEDGIFAISGPTGAGKSTIMDAICLALYGCTPRLPNISKSTNEIMSRQTGECFAEVVFETEEGRFMAHWSQHRARGKATGELQPPKHEISEEKTGKILASQLKTTAAEIEARTGMDFKRFTQSMMLAQGGFAAFLQASPDERAPILEQITGTKIYSQISAHVFQMQKDEKSRIETIKAELAGVIILDDEEVARISGELEQKKKELETVSGNVEQLNTAVLWHNVIQSLRKEKDEISQELVVLEQETADFEPKRAVLKNARKAAPLEAGHTRLNLLRDQQVQDQASLTALQQKLPELEGELKTASEACDMAKKLLKTAETEREQLQTITRRVRLIDQDIRHQNNSGEMLAARIASLSEEKKEVERKKEIALKSLDDLDRESGEIENYLQAHAADAALVTELAGIMVSLQGLTQLRKGALDAASQLTALETKLTAHDQEIERISLRLATEKKELEGLQGKAGSAQSDINGLLRGRTIEEILKRKDDLVLEIAGLEKIANYETDRLKLEDGKACPLCGSVHHPFAEGNVPKADVAKNELAALIGLIGELEKANAFLKNLSGVIRRAEDGIKDILHQNALARQRKDETTIKIEKAKSDLGRARDNLTKASDEVLQQLSVFGIPEIPAEDDGIRELKTDLDNRKKLWQEYNDRKTRIEPQKVQLKADIGHYKDLILSKENERKEKEAGLSDLTDALERLLQRRRELFGEKNPDEEERKSSEHLSSLQLAEKEVSESLSGKRQLLETHKTRTGDLKVAIEKRHTELAQSEQAFTGLLHKQGFLDEAEFLSFRLSEEILKGLETEEQSLNTRATQLQTKGEENLKRLKLEEAKKLTDKEPEEVKQLHDTAGKEQDSLKQLTWELNNRLQTNKREKERAAKILERIEKQTRVYKRWEALNKLIGSADGRKFRNFAQGLTLEIMVYYANRQLEKLSDRYLLTREREEPLELKVIDNYQAGEIRTTKNLSGGESFIVSMALALGLSGMSSRKVRVDSLFLDEGFGSLDEDTLETALSTLAGLRQEGKMIGVISHVGAMKERISTRITVQPVREGRSEISGPGVSKNN